MLTGNSEFSPERIKMKEPPWRTGWLTVVLQYRTMSGRYISCGGGLITAANPRRPASTGHIELVTADCLQAPHPRGAMTTDICKLKWIPPYGMVTAPPHATSSATRNQSAHAYTSRLYDVYILPYICTIGKEWRAPA